ncbi:MAG: hypothetical protein JWP74_1525 [Marmoricola sp.]|nr:hypothetical protein [Marmoricola sp.]
MLSDEKACPLCGESIKAAAIKCRFCMSMLNSPPHPATPGDPGPDLVSSPIVSIPSTLDDAVPPTQLQAGQNVLGVHLGEIEVDVPGKWVAQRVIRTRHSWRLAATGSITNRSTVTGNYAIDIRHGARFQGGRVSVLNLVPGEVRPWTFSDDFKMKSWRDQSHELACSVSIWTETGRDPFTGAVTDTGILARRDPQSYARAGSAKAGGIPLSEWRGVSRMTRSAQISCHCANCGNDWDLDGHIANTVADEQGLGQRLKRSGLRSEASGAAFTPFSSGRRIAAGLENQRLSTQLASALSLAACPVCASMNVRLDP